MGFKKALFTSVSVLTILLFHPQIVSNIDGISVLPQEGVRIVKGRKKLITKINKISPDSKRLFRSPGQGQSLSFFSRVEKRNAIEEDNFFGLDEYFSRDGFTLNFPIDRSLHLATSLSPLNLKRGTKLSLKHRNQLAIFNSELTLGFTGDYGLRFGLTRHF